MKKVFTIALFAGIFIAAMPTLATASPLQDYYDDGPVDYQTFYDELSPYGNWIDDPEYGYVWQPNVGRDFRPYYTNGNWQYTTYGWTWVSSYHWGWAPFHYGRWRVDPYYGWIWIPGYEWGPAWVSWRNNSGYCGWAPMGPGVSINVSFSSGYSVPYDNWCFLPTRYLGARSFWGHCVPFRQNNVYINNTVIVQNTYVYNRRTYVQGPDANYYRRSTGRALAAAPIRSETRPGMDRVSRNEVRMYRPEVRQISNSGGNATRPTPAPQRVIARNDGNRGNGWTRNDNNNRPDNNRNTPERRFGDNNNRNNLPDRNVNNDRNNSPVRDNRNNLPDRNVNTDRNNSPVRDNRNNLPERNVNTDRTNNIPDRNTNPVRENRNNLPERNVNTDRSTPVRENRPERNMSRPPENNNRNFERNVPSNNNRAERSIPQRTPDNGQQRNAPEQRQIQQERSRSMEQPRQAAPSRNYERQDRSQGRQPSAPSNNNSRGSSNERAPRRG